MMISGSSAAKMPMVSQPESPRSHANSPCTHAPIRVPSGARATSETGAMISRTSMGLKMVFVHVGVILSIPFST